MDQFIKPDDIVLLLDHYSLESRNLRISFEKAGYRCPTVVVEDDGFLPDDVLSVYGFFLGNFAGEKGVPGRPKYFNQIVVPDYWEISGNNSVGSICDLIRERGRIFYAEPPHKRLVKVVDWYDENGVVRSSDHYNRYGALYARTAFDAKGKRVNKSWFAASGREIIVENYVTGDIILNEGGQVRFFRGKVDFVLYLLKKVGFEKNRIFYNSLSTPFFVSQSLHSVYKRDVLFWQEPIKGDIPGNMQRILKGEASRTGKIMVQKKHAYDRLLKLGASQEIVHSLGFIYPFEKENMHGRNALICTNSDQVEHLRQIVEAVPEMHFHIAALTEMSPKLMGMESYENVSLYPGVKSSVLDELFKTCDYYLDINKGAEIVSAVYRAFLHNHLIFAFGETMHNSDYVARECIYPLDAAKRLISDIRTVLADGNEMDKWVHRQQKAALAESGEEYLQFWERKRKRTAENPLAAMHITNPYGMDSAKTQIIAQQNVAQIARGLGFLEMPVFRYLMSGDDRGELRKQIVSITSVIRDNDIVVFQSPSWNAAAYDEELLSEIRRHRNVRLVIFIQEMMPMMFGGTEKEYRQIIRSYNLADLLIVPTESMLDFLRKRGLTVKKVLIQPMWDLPFSGDLETPKFQRQIVFSGSPNRFAFLSSWNYEIPLRLFDAGSVSLKGKNVSPEGWKNTTELLTEYTKGGFGLVWEQDLRPDYDRCSQSHELAAYLAAGIPVIIKKGLPHEETILDYGLGFAVGTLEEAADKVKAVSEKEYAQMLNNIKNISTLIRGGFFTKKLLVDAVNYLMLG